MIEASKAQAQTMQEDSSCNAQEKMDAKHLKQTQVQEDVGAESAKSEKLSEVIEVEIKAQDSDLVQNVNAQIANTSADTTNKDPIQGTDKTNLDAPVVQKVEAGEKNDSKLEALADVEIGKLQGEKSSSSESAEVSQTKDEPSQTQVTKRDIETSESTEKNVLAQELQPQVEHIDIQEGQSKSVVQCKNKEPSAQDIKAESQSSSNIKADKLNFDDGQAEYVISKDSEEPKNIGNQTASNKIISEKDGHSEDSQAHHDESREANIANNQQADVATSQSIENSGRHEQVDSPDVSANKVKEPVGKDSKLDQAYQKEAIAQQTQDNHKSNGKSSNASPQQREATKDQQQPQLHGDDLPANKLEGSASSDAPTCDSTSTRFDTSDGSKSTPENGLLEKPSHGAVTEQEQPEKHDNVSLEGPEQGTTLGQPIAGSSASIKVSKASSETTSPEEVHPGKEMIAESIASNMPKKDHEDIQSISKQPNSTLKQKPEVVALAKTGGNSEEKVVESLSQRDDYADIETHLKTEEELTLKRKAALDEIADLEAVLSTEKRSPIEQGDENGDGKKYDRKLFPPAVEVGPFKDLAFPAVEMEDETVSIQSADNVDRTAELKPAEIQLAEADIKKAETEITRAPLKEVAESESKMLLNVAEATSVEPEQTESLEAEKAEAEILKAEKVESAANLTPKVERKLRARDKSVEQKPKKTEDLVATKEALKKNPTKPKNGEEKKKEEVEIVPEVKAEEKHATFKKKTSPPKKLKEPKKPTEEAKKKPIEPKAASKQEVTAKQEVTSKTEIVSKSEATSKPEVISKASVQASLNEATAKTAKSNTSFQEEISARRRRRQEMLEESNDALEAEIRASKASKAKSKAMEIDDGLGRYSARAARQRLLPKIEAPQIPEDAASSSSSGSLSSGLATQDVLGGSGTFDRSRRKSTHTKKTISLKCNLKKSRVQFKFLFLRKSFFCFFFISFTFSPQISLAFQISTLARF